MKVVWIILRSEFKFKEYGEVFFNIRADADNLNPIIC
jgi:hypothetical protein